MDATCTYHLDPAGHRLESEQIYEELSNLTQSVTQLGPYILDQNSLYVNGEHKPSVLCYIGKPIPSLSRPPFPQFYYSLNLLLSL